MPDVGAHQGANTEPPRPGELAPNQLNFHQLYVFHAIATPLSFSRAAEALEITQPAVSIQVQELEKSLGVTLFHRRPRRLGITQVGEVVFAYSQQIFALSNKMVATVQKMQDLETGHLTLGASTTPGEFILPLAVGQFRRLHPGEKGGVGNFQHPVNHPTHPEPGDCPRDGGRPWRRTNGRS